MLYLLTPCRRATAYGPQGGQPAAVPNPWDSPCRTPMAEALSICKSSDTVVRDDVTCRPMALDAAALEAAATVRVCKSRFDEDSDILRDPDPDS
jgi:hypothetical protein